MVVVGVNLFTKLTGFHINLGVGEFVKLHIPFMSEKQGLPDKFNILLTGIGGEGHEWSDLTDTIMLASINKRANSVTLLSIPRDLYIEYPTKGRGKINETFMRAMNKTSVEDGMRALWEKVTDITGESIQWYLMIDFAWFAKFVDVLWWISADVPEDLIDTSYPDNNWGYETFKIHKGIQILDGTTALKYARSRHSTSDFDRSRRQQLVLKAIRDKLFSLWALTSPSKLQGLYYAVTDHIRTNLSFADFVWLALFAKDLPGENILSFHLNDNCFQSPSLCDVGGFLYTPLRENFWGLSVLLPDTATPSKISDYRDIRMFANIVMNYPEVILDHEEIYIVNATKNSWLANRFALKLKRFWLNIPEKNSIFSTKDPHDKSRIYNINTSIDTNKKESSTLEILKFFFPVQIQTFSQPKYAQVAGSHIEIILAQDAVQFVR